MADEKDKKAPKKSEAARPEAKKPEAAKPEARKPDARKAEGKKADAGKEAKSAAPAEVMPKDYVPRLRKEYDDVIRPKLVKQFGYTNVMEVPRIDKIVLNMGIGEGVADRKKVEQAAADLSLIVGQKAVITKSRKSIATYKLRDGQPIGCKVTLRKARMYEFLDRLVNVALPRVRDFRGLNPSSFDGRGNYSLGIKEHIIFPEIDYDKAADVWGMDITVCTSARSDAEARSLLAAFNFPFRQ